MQLLENIKHILLFGLMITIAFTSKAQESVKDTGIKKEITKEGSGDSPRLGQEVKVKVEGRLEDGSVFDSGVMTFVIGDKDMIQGFNEVLPSMKKGEKATVTIPSEMGYGEKGVSQDGEVIIPPNATLIFDIQLVKVY